MDFKVNDYVLIKNDDKIYQIEAIEKNIAYLKGLTYRFQTTSLISELTVAPTLQFCLLSHFLLNKYH